MSVYTKLASAIFNDVVGGLRGYHSNPTMSIEQLEDDIVDERMLIMKEYSLKGILPIRDLLISINCIPVDCKDLDKCNCKSSYTGKPVAHFEIPQLLNDYGSQAIDYIGSTDRQQQFLWSTSVQSFDYLKYRKRGRNKPWVYIDTTPNGNGMCDCYIFNAPMIKQVSITAVFKDPRQLEQYSCCSDYSEDNFSFINSEIKKRLTQRKLYFYRQALPPTKPNDQQYE